MRAFKAALAALALFLMTLPALGDAQFSFDRQACCVVETSKPVAVAVSPAPVAAKTLSAVHGPRTHVFLFCGLLTGNQCALNDLAAKMRAQGWAASVYSHLKDPDSASAAAVQAKRRVIYVGHSRGADNVLAAKKASLVFSIDPTVANNGAQPGIRTYSFYNPWNRWAVICCGGAYADGAINQVWRKEHIAMGRDPALHALIIRRIRGQ